MNHSTQQAKADALRALHHNGHLLVLPNIWNPLGAALLQDIGYAAVATASASIAYTNGYDDGEHIPFNDVLKSLQQIVSSVAIPVTADIESGYTANNNQLKDHIKKLISTGIAGINFEDSHKQNGQLLSIEEQSEKIKLIKNTAAETGVPLFINARTDVYIKADKAQPAEEKFNEALKRGKAYIAAGADCFFPILMKEKQDIQNLVAALKAPVNILAVPGVPDLKTLHHIGVARVSLGPGFLKVAIRALKEIALRLKNYEGLENVTSNAVTSDYLKTLINR